MNKALREEITRSVILNRRSCRSFRSEVISEDDLLDLVKAGIYAPSGSNAQNQRFLIIQDKSEIARIGAIRWVWPYKSTLSLDKLQSKHSSGIVGHAAALIFVFADAGLNDRRNSGEYYIWESLEIQNCAASIQNILLLATAKGIGSCWISCSQNMEFSRLLRNRKWDTVFDGYEIPESYKVQGLIILGYPKQIDNAGFPKGENIHGVIQDTTLRKEVPDYLVKKSKTSHQADLKVKFIDRVRLYVFSRVIKFLASSLNKISKDIYRIEKKYLDTLP